MSITNLFYRKHLLVNHTPNQKLNQEEKDYILKNGLVHFFSDQFLDETLKNGLHTDWDRPMKKAEKDLLWFFINDETGNKEGLKEFHSKKADHRTSDIKKTCKCVWYPNETEIEQLRFRPCGRAYLLFYTYNAPALVYGADIAAKDMEITRVQIQ